MKRYETDWLDYCANVLGASPHTIKAYRHALAQYRRYLKDTRKTSPLRADFGDVVAFVSYLASRYSRSTVRVRLAAVRNLHAFLEAAGYRTTDPAAAVKFRKVRDADRVRPYASHPAELVELVRAQLDTPAKRCAFALMYDLALRVSSAAGMERDDIDLVSWNVHCTVKGGRHLTLPVWEAHARRAILEQWQATAGRIYLLPGTKPGTHLTTATLNRWVHEAATAAGLDSCQWSPHALRHSRSDALDGLLDPIQRGRYLGHSSMHSTATYTSPKLPNSAVLLPNLLATHLRDDWEEEDPLLARPGLAPPVRRPRP